MKVSIFWRGSQLASIPPCLSLPTPLSPSSRGLGLHLVFLTASSSWSRSPRIAAFPVTSAVGKVPRTDLVAGVIARLQEHHLVQIRGSPASGKSVLLQLLVRALPFDASVHLWTDAWPEETEGSKRAVKRAELQKLWTDSQTHRQHTYLLIDEAQTTYDDVYLWNNQLKVVADQRQSYFHVAVACPWGNTNPTTDYAPIRLQRHHMISLRPQEGLIENPLGLLFNEEELEEYYQSMIAARAMPPIDDALKLLIHSWTHGYISAVMAILTFIGSHVDFIRDQKPFTFADFRKTPLPTILKTLQVNAILARVLPTGALAKDPRIYAVFSYLFHHECISSDATGNSVPSNIHPDDIKFAHNSGLLYLNRVSEDKIEYDFAFPLQKTLLQNRLTPSSPDLMLNVTLRELVKEAIGSFNPDHLSAQKRIKSAAGGTVRPLEALYRQELYSSLFKLRPRIIVSPEYGPSKGYRPAGRIDFWIQCPPFQGQSCWGIDVLCDADRIVDHIDRFDPDGAYHDMRLDGMSEFLILDFRSDMPFKPHPSIHDLLHVVFSRDWTEAVLYDNNLIELWKFMLARPPQAD
ncbi:hypothetical protein B0H16DRAFT_1513708 [Mycena metata]|uniref:Uncharacterized protein n=1 Tax=Mycena metata TaxID=1033252 RepID=A0AAD7JTD1_9AGAR|nr:hypothetical protein B0H16DRAFT_1513708 [Mycena metata]